MSAKLLPCNATYLQRVLADASHDLLSEAGPLIELLNGLWNPATCRLDLLPYLAWALGVDEWDSEWDEATQRRMVAESYAIHAIKGTPAAIKRMLSLAGYGDASITEYRRTFYNGAHAFDGGIAQTDTWFAFDVSLNADETPSTHRIERIVAAIQRGKPVRACLRLLTRAQHKYDGASLYDGSVVQSLDVLYQAGTLETYGPFDGGIRADGSVTYGYRNPACGNPIYDGSAQFNGAIIRG
jgi:phage tail P2-like protein